MTHRDAGRWLPVSGQQCKEVVGAVVAATADERQVRWVGTTVGVAGSLLVGVGAGKEGGRGRWLLW